MIGQSLPVLGHPTVVTRSLPSRLTTPPVSRPKLVVLALMVIWKVPPDCAVKVSGCEALPGQVLTVKWLFTSSVNVPPLVIQVALSPHGASCLVSLAARSMRPPAAFSMLTCRCRMPPPPCAVLTIPVFVMVGPPVK